MVGKGCEREIHKKNDLYKKVDEPFKLGSSKRKEQRRPL